MKTITMAIDPGTLGTDAEFPEAFARYCEERLAREFPAASIEVEIGGTGRSILPDSVDENGLWDAYCSLPAAEYRRLADAVPAERRAEYLAAID